MKPMRSEIEDAIVGILASEDEGWAVKQSQIVPDARLVSDLGLDSQDVLHLMASINMRFRRRFLFNKLVVKDAEAREYVDVTVRQLVDFVDENFDSTQPPRGAAA